MKRILIINPFGIGDVLFTTPVIRAIRERFPFSFIGYLCNRRTEDILSTNPKVDEVFVFEKDEWRLLWQQSRLRCVREFLRFLRKIKKRRFDLTIDLSLGRHYSFFSWLIGIKRRVGFNYKNRGRLLTDKIDIRGYEKKHVVEHYLDLIKILNIVPKVNNLEIFISEQEQIWAERFLREGGISENDFLIGISPAGGASWGKDSAVRHWAKEKFAQVADRLSEKYSARVIIFGEKREEEVCQGVVDLMRNEPVKTYGKLNLPQFITLLSKCKLLITNEGGPLQIAVALRVKSVSVFGPVDERVYGPYPKDKIHLVVKKDIPCRPCYKRFKMPICLRERECINSITADEVLRATENLIFGGLTSKT